MGYLLFVLHFLLQHAQTPLHRSDVHKLNVTKMLENLQKDPLVSNLVFYLGFCLI